MNIDPRVIDFRNLGLKDLERVGGKNASLGELIGHLTNQNHKVDQHKKARLNMKMIY